MKDKIQCKRCGQWVDGIRINEENPDESWCWHCENELRGYEKTTKQRKSKLGKSQVKK